MPEAKKYLILFGLLGAVALAGLYLAYAGARNVIPENTAAEAIHTVLIDTSVAYATQYERPVSTSSDFFNRSGLAVFPANAGAWTGKDVTFDNLTYSFYGTDEITGREYTRGNDIVYMHLIHGPKLYWHDPRNCYIFSGWAISDSGIEPVIIGDTGGSYLPGDGQVIHVNRFTAQKDGAKYSVLYWYVFKDRVSVYDVSMAILYVPFEDDISAALDKEKSLAASLFSTGSGNDTSQTGAFPGEMVSYAEDNPPQITQWLVAGPWYTGDASVVSSYSPADRYNNWLGESPSLVAPAPGMQANGTQWTVLNSSYGIVHLDPLYSYNVPGYAYAFLYVYSPVSRDALLQVSSDDGARIWMNGALVHSRIRQDLSSMLLFDHPMLRGSSLEDTVPVRLRQGWNRLLVEVYQWKASWEYYVQFRDTAGHRISDLNFSVEPQQYVEIQPAGDQGMTWQAGYADNSSDEFSMEWYVDSDYYVSESFKEFPRALSSGDPEIYVHFRLTEAEASRSHKLILKAVSVDEAHVGFIQVNVSANGRSVGDYQYPRDWLTGIITIDSNSLHAGDNVIGLQRAKGADFVIWDYVRLEQAASQSAS